jgi:hypothetical protein
MLAVVLGEEEVDRLDDQAGDGRPSLGSLELVEPVELTAPQIELGLLGLFCCDSHSDLLLCGLRESLVPDTLIMSSRR